MEKSITRNIIAGTKNKRRNKRIVICENALTVMEEN